MSDLISRQAAIDIADDLRDCISVDGYWAWMERLKKLPSAQPEQQHGRVFKGIVVEYPSINTYPEYKGKPYFLIKYTENGQEFIGYGTYKPEVLSEFLKEYFMPSAQPEERTNERTETHACDSISRQAAMIVIENSGLDDDSKDTVVRVLEQLPSAQPEPEEDCDTCKHGYFGDSQCNNCRVRFPSHYEREEEQHEET